MEWVCNCGKPVTTIELQWVWRNAADIGHKTGRYVCYNARLGCGDCLRRPDDNDGYQYIQVKLTAATKKALVDQILAQVLKRGTPGYIPRTDIQEALRNIRKQG
jgi:hypothetical protein